MNTKIQFTYKDVPYTLEYNRNAIQTIESQGFNFNDFKSAPFTNVTLAFYGSFIKNHRNTSQKLIDEIYDGMTDKSGLIEALTTMIAECYNTLLDDSKSGNITWSTVSPTK